MTLFSTRQTLASSLTSRCTPLIVGLSLMAWQPLLLAQNKDTLANQAAASSHSADSLVRAELTQLLVVLEDGKELLKPVKSVKPGDLIEYRVVYTNQSRRAVTDLQAQLPLPEGLEYQAKSARPAASAQMATKGGMFAREPLMRDIAGGKKEAVSYADYRQVRWNLGQIAAGAKLEVSARARVSTGVASTPVIQNASDKAVLR
ncbi:MAG: DUF11 domain-containing protein [Betaproteobacteria bacterium]|nr:DUF11 domain-containing protein [Betaproteobacteria bacterium]